MGPCAPSNDIQLDRMFHYQSNDGSCWQLWLHNGCWFQRHGDGWVRVPASYLNQLWHFKNGCWAIQPNKYQGLTNAQCAFEQLAFDLLPFWSRTILESPNYRAADVKGWSYHGATRRHGDVGNRCMHMVVELCEWLRFTRGHQSLWELQRRNCEHRSDQLEAIMGLRDIDPRWRYAGDVVDVACSATYEAWAFDVDASVVLQRLVQRLDLEGLVRRLREYDEFLVNRQRAMLIQACHVAFHKKLQARRCIMLCIVQFCQLH